MNIIKPRNCFTDNPTTQYILYHSNLKELAHDQKSLFGEDSLLSVYSYIIYKSQRDHISEVSVFQLAKSCGVSQNHLSEHRERIVTCLKILKANSYIDYTSIPKDNAEMFYIAINPESTKFKSGTFDEDYRTITFEEYEKILNVGRTSKNLLSVLISIRFNMFQFHPKNTSEILWKQMALGATVSSEDIATATGISIPTVTSVIKKLHDLEIIYCGEPVKEYLVNEYCMNHKRVIVDRWPAGDYRYDWQREYVNRLINYVKFLKANADARGSKIKYDMPLEIDEYINEHPF